MSDLPEGEHAFTLLVDAVRDYAIFLMGPDGIIRSWNLGAQRIKGYTRDEIIGRHFSVFYTNEERAEDLPSHLLAIAQRDGSAASEGWRVRKDGTRFWADVIITALRNQAGELYGYAKVTRDATERRANEERLRQLLIAQEARKAAEQALKARDRFLSVAAHELRTPVTTLRLSTDVLLRQRAAGTFDEAQLATGLARLDRASDRLVELVNELLDVSKLTAATATPKLVATDMADLVGEAVELYRQIYHARRLDLIAETGLIASVDRARIEQVVSNVVDNALKYSDEAVRIDVTRSAGGVLLEVADHGIGVDPDTALVLDEPFTRGANAGHTQGLGLGLYISRGIVEQHGGWLRLSSDGPGHGTTVRVWLPNQPDGAAPKTS